MKIIVAVYDDWGIGVNGSQPIILKADRQFFRAMTSGATVVVGRKTASDFPGNTPLPERTNILLTRSEKGIDGFISCRDPEEVLTYAHGEDTMGFFLVQRPLPTRP